MLNPLVAKTDRAREMLDPAINGTLGILQAAAKAGSVKTFVLTSSYVSPTSKSLRTL